MALIGKITLYEWVKDTENPVTENVIRPDGSEETITYPPMILKEGEVIEDAYVLIKMASIHLDDNDRILEEVDNEGNIIGEVIVEQERGNTKNGYKLNIRYCIYDSKDLRQDKFHKPKHEIDEMEWIMIDDLNLGGKNLIEYSYDWIKNKKGFEELIND
tara:strand:+ start:139 stop:615 length:477 start_codon:yes stop_codon:yes gene_type:complete